MKKSTFNVIGRRRKIRSDNWEAVGMYVDADSGEEALRIATNLWPKPAYEWEQAIKFPENW